MHRRGLLKLGVVGAAAITAVGGVLLLLQESVWRGNQFNASAIAVLTAVSVGLLEGSLPESATTRLAAIEHHIERLVVTVSGLPLASQRELARLLSILSMAPGRLALSSLATDWSRASRDDVHAALETMRTSRTPLRRQVYHALRDLTRATWFANKSSWPALGYPGPQAVT